MIPLFAGKVRVLLLLVVIVILCSNWNKKNVVSAQEYTMIQLQGSGTTNPQQCYWDVMNEIVKSASQPIRFTYRSIGTTRGIAELKETIQSANAYNHSQVFFSGDAPISSSDYDDINENDDDSNNTRFIQIPVLAGAVNFFHNIDGMYGDNNGGSSTNDDVSFDDIDLHHIDDNFFDDTDLQLSPCILAKIYTFQIKTWNHADILALNPELQGEIPLFPNTTIEVLVRSTGSSSTLAMTTYLNKACPGIFPAEYVSELPDWSVLEAAQPGSSYTRVANSTEMIFGILYEPYTIGYSDVGQAAKQDLYEVALLINDVYRVSNAPEVSVTDAITVNQFPPSPQQNYPENVNFIAVASTTDKAIWPMVLVTYMYVPMDLSQLLPNPIARSLLYAFLSLFYDNDYMSNCWEKYQFHPLPDAVQLYGRTGIALIQNYPSNEYNATTQEWKLEKNLSNDTTIPYGYPYVLSKHQNDLAAMVRDDLSIQVKEIEEELLEETLEELDDMEDKLYKLRNSYSRFRTQIVNGSGATTAMSPNNDNNQVNSMEYSEMEFEELERRLNAAMAFSTISFSFCVLFLVFMVYRCYRQPTMLTQPE